MSSKRTLKIIGAGIAVLLLFVITILTGPPVAVSWVHVPAFEGRIRAPEKFVFEGYEIEVSWRCFKTNPFLGFVQTYSACGRDADGSLTIEVGADGRFQFPRLLQWHVNFFTDNEYALDGRIRDRQGAVNVFRFYYDERRNRLVPELNSVRLIVIQPARIEARTFARRGADVIPFADVAQWFPQHGTLHHGLALEADTRAGEGRHRVTFVPGDVEIPTIPMLIEDRGQTHADLELEISAVIWLPIPESAREEGPYKQYGEEIRRKAAVPLTDYIEVPASLLEPVEYEADLSEVPAWAFRYKPEVRCPRVRSVEGAARCGQAGG